MSPKLSVTFEDVVQVESAYFTTKGLQDTIHVSLPIFSVRDSVPRAGIVLSARDAADLAQWNSFADVLHSVIYEYFPNHPSLQQLVDYLERKAELSPWQAVASHLPGYLLALRRFDAARTWAMRVVEGPLKHPDDMHVIYADEIRKEWARTLLSSQH